MSRPLLVYCTFPSQKSAESVARAVVEARLAACVNLLESARSVYRWQGEICAEDECMAIAKTTQARFGDLKAKILELHPYDCPEVIAVQIADGHDAYMQWIATETS